MTGRPVALVLRALGLGDVVTGLPALRLLRSALPEHRIVLAAPRHFEPVIRLAGTVDDVVQASGLRPPHDAPPRADVAIDLHGKGPQSHDVLRALEPRRLVAFGLDGHVWAASEHEVARWCRLIGEAFSVPVGMETVAGTLRAPDVAMPRGLVIVHPGAGSPARRWPPERFAALAGLLHAVGHDVVVTGGPGEAGLAAAVADAGHVAVRAGISLVELFALVANARLVVSGDTGIAHVASAYGTPSVVLFGPVSPAVWGPPPDPRHQVVWHGDVHRGQGDPHGRQIDPALAAISVREVRAACDRALAHYLEPLRA